MTTAPKPEVKVRVNPEPMSLPEADKETRDYQFLLNENIALLRDANKDAQQLLQAKKQLEELKKQLEQLEKSKSRMTFFGFVAKCAFTANFPLSIALALSGPALWLTHHSPAEACLTVIPGIIWFAVSSTIISDKVR